MKPVTGFPVFVPQSPSLSAMYCSEQRVSTSFRTTARLQARLRISGCLSPLGPFMMVQTSLVLQGIEARMIFRNRAPGVPGSMRSFVRASTLVPAGEHIAHHEHRMRGLPPQSHIALTALDHEGTPLTEELDLGQCIDGARDVEMPLTTEATAVAWVSALGWSERHGPRLRLSGELTFPRGVLLQVGVPGTKRVPAMTGAGAEAGEPDAPGVCISDTPLIGPGMTFYAKERTIEDAPSGTPWVSVRFADASGGAIGEEHVIGRCTPS